MWHKLKQVSPSHLLGLLLLAWESIINWKCYAFGRCCIYDRMYIRQLYANPYIIRHHMDYCSPQPAYRPYRTFLSWLVHSSFAIILSVQSIILSNLILSEGQKEKVKSDAEWRCFIFKIVSNVQILFIESGGVLTYWKMLTNWIEQDFIFWRLDLKLTEMWQMSPARKQWNEAPIVGLAALSDISHLNCVSFSWNLHLQEILKSQILN